MSMIFISQEKYARNLVKKFGLEQAKAIRTPAATQIKVSKDGAGKKVDESLYQSIIGSLLYLTASRLDIAYVFCVCARYQTDPHEFHLHFVKRILKYILETIDFRIWYSFDTTIMLVGYCDDDWIGCADDRKSTSGGCFFLENNMIAWFRKKHNCISLSTVEVEYIAAGSSCT
ncbi:hypothetical protein IC582_004220 [Cucumis melo]